MDLRSSSQSGRGSGGGRGRGRGRGWGGRSGGSSATAPAPSPAPAAPVAPGPPPAVPIRLDVVAATVVETSPPLENLPCQAVLGGLGGASRKRTRIESFFRTGGAFASSSRSTTCLLLLASMW